MSFYYYPTACPLCDRPLSPSQANLYCDACLTTFKLYPQTCPSCKGWGIIEWSTSESHGKNEPNISHRWIKCDDCKGSKVYKPKPRQYYDNCQSRKGSGKGKDILEWPKPWMFAVY